MRGGEVPRRQQLFRLSLDTLNIVEVNISVDHLVDSRESSRPVPQITCFEDGEEIFGQEIVIRVPIS